MVPCEIRTFYSRGSRSSTFTDGESVAVTEAEVTMVAVDEQGQKVPLSSK